MAKFKLRFIYLVAILFVAVIAAGIYMKTEGFQSKKVSEKALNEIDKQLSVAVKAGDKDTVITLMEGRNNEVKMMKKYKAPEGNIIRFCDKNGITDVGCTKAEVKTAQKSRSIMEKVSKNVFAYKK